MGVLYMRNTTYGGIIESLERAKHSAEIDAGNLAEYGESDQSIYQDGVAHGLAQALDIVRSWQDHPETGIII